MSNRLYEGDSRDDPFLIEITCSRRFDGWKFQEQTGFSFHQALGGLLRGENPELSIDEKMDVFFFIERSWYWAWALAKTYSEEVLVYETLFFEMCDLDVNPDYRKTHYCEPWDTYYKPRLAEVKQIVRRDQEQRLAWQREHEAEIHD